MRRRLRGIYFSVLPCSRFLAFLLFIALHIFRRARPWLALVDLTRILLVLLIALLPSLARIRLFGLASVIHGLFL